MVLVDGKVDDVFTLEPLLLEEGADVGGFYDIPEGLCLCLQITAFQTENAVG